VTPGSKARGLLGTLRWVAPLLWVAFPVSPLASQSLVRERAEYTSWLATGPFSPYAALALQPIGPGVALGPASADIPLPGFPAAQVIEERGLVFLQQHGGRRALPRNRPVTIGDYRLLAAGVPGRSQLVVYGTPRGVSPPSYYAAAAGLSFTLPLEQTDRRGAFRTLGPDGLETEASEAGFLTLPLPGGGVRLRVYRMSGGGEDEAELQVFFRDSTNGRGSYPAGRFVTLDPAGGGRYRLDFNRARNPFCAYNTVFPCPPPWPGNSIPATIAAGERYDETP
jgi:Protein of unknown function (DUF1684)